MCRLIPFLLFTIYLAGCKKENSFEPQLSLFLTFEKDGEEFHFEGNELYGPPWFSTNKEIIEGNSSSDFIFKSGCRFNRYNSVFHNSSLRISFAQFDTSLVFTESGIDKMFGEGEKDLEGFGILLRPLDSIHNYIFIRYTQDFPHSYTTYDHGDCDDSSTNYFKITKVEKIFNYGANEDIRIIIIEAEFDLSLCSNNDKKIRLENGKLRFHYNIDFE